MRIACPNKSGVLYKELLKLNNNDEDLTTYAHNIITELQDLGLMSLTRYKKSNGEFVYTIPKTITERSIAKNMKGEKKSPYEISMDKLREIDEYLTYYDIDFIQPKVSASGDSILIDLLPVENKTFKQVEQPTTETKPNRIQEEIKNKPGVQLDLFEQPLATQPIKPGVPELFESNPELANAVYEAAGFGQDDALESKLKTFFNNFGFKFKEGDSSTDLLNKIIYTSSKDSSLFINNSVKAISQLLLANTNIDFHKLEGLIEDTPEFKKLLSNSSNYLKTTHKFLKDGNRIPMEEWVSYIKDYNKIKNEVLEKYIKESLLDGKNSTGLHKLINDFLKWFKDLFKNAKNLKEVTDSLIQQVLLNQKEVIINSKDLQNKERVTLAKALEETTHGKNIIKTFGEFGLILTGSVSAAEQGSVFRKVGKLLHDIDWVVPKGFTKDFNKKLKDTFPGATLVREFDSSTYYTQTYIVPPKGYIISNLTFFKPEVYGERKYIASYDVLDKNGNIVSNYRRYYDIKESGKVVENREVYNEGLKNVDKNLEAVSVDFFQNKEDLKYEPYTVNTEGVNLQLSNWLSSFTEKLKYGRAKDLLDYANFIPNDVIPSIPQITPQQKQQAQQLYSQYLDQIFPDSKVKDIVYHTTTYYNHEMFLKYVKDNYNKDYYSIRNEEERNRILKEFKEKIKIPFEKFSKSKFGKGDKFIAAPDGIYISLKQEDKYYKEGILMPLIVNLKNPLSIPKEERKTVDFTWDYISKILGVNKTSLIKDTYEKYEQIEFDEPVTVKSASDLLQEKKYDGIFNSDLKMSNVVFEPEQIHILGSKQDIEGFKEFVEKTPTQTTDNFNQEDTQIINNLINEGEIKTKCD